MSDTKAEFDRVLGERIRKARDEAGVTQDELGGLVGLSRTSITNIERGRQGVQAYLLTRIATVLGRSPGALLPPEEAATPAMLSEKVKNLEPRKREWAERVMKSTPEDDDHAA